MTPIDSDQLPGNYPMRRLVADTARARGLEPRIALAFASVESRFDPRAEGDKTWHLKEAGERYNRLVRDAPQFADNPARLEPWKWHSYGLFQLLAPYHVLPNEDPTVLFDPVINAQRGVETIKRLLVRSGGDPIKARLLYTGATRKAASIQAEITQRISVALEQFANEV